MADQTSLGLSLKLPPEIAEHFRQKTTTSVLISDGPGVATTDTGDVLPSVFLDAVQLIGYAPESAEEMESVRSQLVSAMWSRYLDRNDVDETDHSDQVVPPPDFDLQVIELLESQVATFRETHSTATTTLTITYPPTLQSPETLELVSTKSLWAELHSTPSDFPVFTERLWELLRECSRSLFWKRDMAVALKKLIRDELIRMEYQDWTTHQRQAKLEQLYSIRETLVHQMEMEEGKLNELENRREEKVKESMQDYRRRSGCGDNGMVGFGTTELSFPEELQLLGFRDEGAVSEGDSWSWHTDDSYHSSSSDMGDVEEELSTPGQLSDQGDNGYDGEEDDHQNVTEPSEIIPSTSHGLMSASTPPPPDLPPSDSCQGSNDEAESDNNAVVPEDGSVKHKEPVVLDAFVKRKERREKAKRRNREKQKAAKKEAKGQELKEVEDKFREQFTDKDFVLSKTMFNALTNKVKKVDDLLESLQEEEWEAEEEAAEAGAEDVEAEDKHSSDESFSLLDQILAMILGASQKASGLSTEDHYRFIKAEHSAMICSWEDYFGRLPPAASSNQFSRDGGQEDRQLVGKPKLTWLEQRQALGIEENEGVWDASDEEEEMENEQYPGIAPVDHTKESAPPQKFHKAKIGLRPGGSR